MTYQQQINATRAEREPICEACPLYIKADKRCGFNGNFAAYKQAAPWEECDRNRWAASQAPVIEEKRKFRKVLYTPEYRNFHDTHRGVMTSIEYFEDGHVLGNGTVIDKKGGSN